VWSDTGGNRDKVPYQLCCHDQFQRQCKRRRHKRELSTFRCFRKDGHSRYNLRSRVSQRRNQLLAAEWRLCRWLLLGALSHLPMPDRYQSHHRRYHREGLPPDLRRIRRHVRHPGRWASHSTGLDCVRFRQRLARAGSQSQRDHRQRHDCNAVVTILSGPWMITCAAFGKT
jgi:hypothetical protein